MDQTLLQIEAYSVFVGPQNSESPDSKADELELRLNAQLGMV